MNGFELNVEMNCHKTRLGKGSKLVVSPSYGITVLAVLSIVTLTTARSLKNVVFQVPVKDII